MSEKTMSVTEAARNFSKIIRRAERQGATVLTRNGKPVARVVPVTIPDRTTRTFADAWSRLPHLSPAEAASFADDIEAARKNLLPPVSPWDKS